MCNGITGVGRALSQWCCVTVISKVGRCVGEAVMPSVMVWLVSFRNCVLGQLVCRERRLRTAAVTQGGGETI